MTPGRKITASQPSPTTTLPGEEYATAFLGNSYTARNDLPGMYRSVLGDTSAFEQRPLTTEAATAGGRQLHEHVDQLQNGGDVASVLDSEWDTVVIQEQSQIPGLSAGHWERERSVASVLELADAAAGAGARTVLFMTWGRRTGDDYNPEWYPDFETMQERLAEGYRAMADEIEAAGHPVAVAPVGLAFREIYDSVAAAGTEPATEGTAFWELYTADGSHPSRQGTYLAALVIAGTATEISPEDVSYAPDSIGDDRAWLLRTAASNALDG